LKELLLRNNALVGDAESALQNLTSLEHLDLSFNNVDFPENFMFPTSLKYLELWEVGTSTQISTEIGRLSNLIVLDLDSNKGVQGTVPTELGLLTSLRALFLRENNLSGTFPWSSFGGERLSHLSLDRNSLTGSIPEDIGRFYNLTFFMELRY
jgi:Leucine-rich repeat (LRR) protein